MAKFRMAVHSAYNLTVLSMYNLSERSLKKQLIVGYVIAWIFGAMVTHSHYGNVVWLVINTHFVYSLMLFAGHILPEIEYRLLIRKLEKREKEGE